MILSGNRVGYIDFGITGSISSYSRQNLVALTLAYTHGDLEGMCDAFFRVSAMDSRSNAKAFRAGLDQDAKSWYENDGTELHLRKNFTLVMLDMLRLSRATGIWPERDVIKYIRSAIAIDGLITRFAPTFDLSGHLKTVCSRHLQWHSRRSLFTLDQFLRTFAPAFRLFRDGAVQASGTMARLISPRAARSDDNAERASVGALRRQALMFSVFSFLACVSLSASTAKVQLGLNLFTSEAAMVAIGLFALLNTVRKLASGGRQSCAI
jgi:predicted unusual protein kinase regulating ubiquinone biosynthesis (AarF/ABC1/UbiB family)